MSSRSRMPVASARPLTNGDAAEVQPEQLDLASAHAPGWHGFVDPTRVEVLSNGPVTRAYVYRGLLTPEECDHIVGVSQTRLMRSGVVDTETGASAVSEIRTSSGARRGGRDLDQWCVVGAGRTGGSRAAHGAPVSGLHE